jgi:hypothetical protein
VIAQHACVAAIALGLAAGCAEHLKALERTPMAGGSRYFFWPPPEATAVWAGDPSARSFGIAVARIQSALRAAGYAEQRLVPIGLRCEHGFALTTRLERVDQGGAPSAFERWSLPYPEAASVEWLVQERRPRMPAPGRFRVLLVALTDLPLNGRGRATPWNEHTVMTGPGAPADVIVPGERIVTSAYRIGVFIYEYESTATDGDGAFVPRDPRGASGYREGDRQDFAVFAGNLSADIPR